MKNYLLALIGAIFVLVGYGIGHPSSKPRLVLVQRVVVCNKPQGAILVASDGESQEADADIVVPKTVQQAILTIPCQGDQT